MASKLPKTLVNSLPTVKDYAELGPEALSKLSTTVYNESNNNKDTNVLPLIRKWLKGAERDSVKYAEASGWTVDRINRIKSKFKSMHHYIDSASRLRIKNPKGFAFTKEEEHLLNPRPITGISESQIKAMKDSGVLK